MLEISVEKVARIILLAREIEEQATPEDDYGRHGNEEARDAGGSYSAEFTSYIDGLNDDEQAALVALMWIGRGTYEPEDLSEAMSTARSERINATSAYLAGVPMLADHLEDGLDKLGYSVTDVEDDVM